MIGLDSFCVGFFRGVVSGKPPLLVASLLLYNDIKIWQGLLQGGLVRMIMRLTYELPQTIVGFLLAQVLNYAAAGIVYRVADVSVLTYHYPQGQAVSLGSYLIGTKELRAESTLCIHEYGHCLQSRWWGPLYLLVIGLPSVMSVLFAPAQHHLRWFEQEASLRGYLYFYAQAKACWNHTEDPLPAWFYPYIDKVSPIVARELAQTFFLKQNIIAAYGSNS